MAKSERPEELPGFVKNFLQQNQLEYKSLFGVLSGKLLAANERSQPGFNKKKRVYAELIRKAFSYLNQDWLTKDYVVAEARRNRDSYLQKAEEIDAAYNDASSPIFDTEGCVNVAAFAHRHLSGMSELDGYSLEDITAVLKAYHELQWTILVAARKLENQSSAGGTDETRTTDFSDQDKIIDLERRAAKKIRDLREQIMSDELILDDDKPTKIAEMTARVEKELLREKRRLGYKT